MTFCPSNRIVPASNSPAIVVRGMSGVISNAWPSSTIGSGADYNVDFSDTLSRGEYITSVAFQTDGIATQSWVSIFGNIVTGWLTWTSSGYMTVPVCVLTNRGVTYQTDISVYVSSEATILTPNAPLNPNDSSALAGLKSMRMLYIDSLPTHDPEDGHSEWNNGGIITRSIKP